jgi:hypothetical protein
MRRRGTITISGIVGVVGVAIAFFQYIHPITLPPAPPPPTAVFVNGTLQATDRPLPYVPIGLIIEKHGEVTNATDDTGGFVFENVPDGIHFFVVFNKNNGIEYQKRFIVTGEHKLVNMGIIRIGLEVPQGKKPTSNVPISNNAYVQSKQQATYNVALVEEGKELLKG